MNLDRIVDASEEQSELLEKLKETMKRSEERILTEDELQQIVEILSRLSELRKDISALADLEGEDADLLKEFYAIVGGEEERMLFQELLELVKKGRIRIPREVVEKHLQEIDEFTKLFR